MLPTVRMRDRVNIQEAIQSTQTPEEVAADYYWRLHKQQEAEKVAKAQQRIVREQQRNARELKERQAAEERRTLKGIADKLALACDRDEKLTFALRSMAESDITAEMSAMGATNAELTEVAARLRGTPGADQGFVWGLELENLREGRFSATLHAPQFWASLSTTERPSGTLGAPRAKRLSS